MVDATTFDAIAFDVSGIGEEGTFSGGAVTDANGYLFATDGIHDFDAIASPVAEYKIKSVLDDEGLGSIPVSSMPFSKSQQWSGYDFHLEATNFVAEKFLHEQKRATTTLTSDISDADTTIDTNDTTLENTVIYVDSETILIGSHDGSGTYSNCTRAVYQSKARAHTNGANVYTTVPQWSERRVTLYTFDQLDATQTKVQRWVGRISESAHQDKGQIVIPCDQHVAGIQSKGGYESRQPTDISFARWSGTSEVTDRIRLSTGGSGYTPKIVNPANQYTTLTINGLDYLYFGLQVEGEIVPAFAHVDSNGDYTGVWKTYTAPDGSPSEEPLFGNRFDGPETKNNGFLTQDTEAPDPDTFREVFAADRSRGRTPIAPLDNAHPDFYKWHPLAYWACIVLSQEDGTGLAQDFDIIKPDWSVNALPYFEDGIVQDCKDLIDATPDYQIDRVVLGWDGEPVELWKRTNELFLHPFGFYLGINDKGEATMNQIGSVDVSDYDNARGNKIDAEPSDVLNLNSGRSQTIDTIKATIGETPVTEGDIIRVSARDGAPRRASDNQGGSDLELNLSTIDPDRSTEIKEKVIGRVILQHFSIPRLRIRAKDQAVESLDYSIGAAVTLNDLPLEPEWLITKDGNRITTISDDVEFTGSITGRQFHPRQRNYDLDLMLIGDELVRWRAPSGMITGSDASGTELILDDPDGSSNSSFDSDSGATKDASYFTAGDDVAVWNQDGTEWSSTSGEIREVDSVNTGSGKNEVVLKNGFSTDPSTASNTKVLRLAHADTNDSGTGYNNDTLGGTFSFVDRAYVLMADDSDTIGDADDDNDEYGA